MKKILLATSNKDKFQIVKFFLRKVGFPENEYEILSLKDINYNGPDEKEQGGIQERAKAKALAVKANLSNENDFELIIGLDDGIELKGTLRPNVKDHLNMILFENYLERDELIIFPRAYACVNRAGKIFETVIRIKYKYRPNDNLKIEPNSYPLSQVATPLNSDKPLSEMDRNEANNYCWECCRAGLIEFFDRVEL